jgi:outer membrane protein assembly factor BamD (BamD/ComL family)
MSYRRIFSVLVFFPLFLVSCSSGPVVIPGDITAEELIQRAQEASDRNRYAVSLQYYEAILERFPSDLPNVCAAEYEIAFIHYKQKKYAEAKDEFMDLLARYENPDEELLPGQFKILATKILAKIDALEKHGNKGEPAAEISGAS